MKRTDPKFLETFVVLHDDENEVIIRKDCITTISTGVNYDDKKKTFIDCGSEGVHHVEESIDEVLELL